MEVFPQPAKQATAIPKKMPKWRRGGSDSECRWAKKTCLNHRDPSLEGKVGLVEHASAVAEPFD